MPIDPKNTGHRVHRGTAHKGSILDASAISHIIEGVSAVIIYLGGDGPANAPSIKGEIVATIAADSGLHLANSYGVPVNLVVGDMDSVEPSLLKRYDDQGIHISRFPQEKDETDFELAILAAGNYIADTLIVIGGGGKHLDHLLANVSVLAGSQTEKWIVDMYTKNEHIYVCRPDQERTIPGESGSAISIVPVGGNAVVTTSGLKWELEESTLEVFSARGISNEFTYDVAKIETSRGSIAIITDCI